MVLGRTSEDSPPRSPRGQQERTFEGGPVFVPSRPLSALGRQLMAPDAEQERVTAYDDSWYAERSLS